MRLQYFISDNFCSYYLPFLLYRESINKIIKTNYNIELEYVYNFNNLVNSDQTIILLNIYSLNLHLIEILKNYNSKIIIINTEYINNFNINNMICKIHNECKNINILEYNVLNISIYKQKFNNIKWYFIPLCYNIYLEEYYNSQITNKINYNNKDIDIIFYGSLNNRRNLILENLKNKYNIVIVPSDNSKNTNKELCCLIERSKIVLNIIYYADNNIFDYYRNSFLLANKILLISESPANKNYEIENKLEDLEKNIISADYDNLVNTVQKYINISEEEYNNLVNKQYESFKKYKMENKVTDFFNKI
jgi:hypothetical protein